MLTTADIAFRAQAMACCSDEAGNNLIHICILLGIHGTYWYLISFQFLYEAFRVCFFAAVHIAKWHTSTWWDVHLVRLVFWIYLELLSLWRIIGDRILFFFLFFLGEMCVFQCEHFIPCYRVSRTWLINPAVESRFSVLHSNELMLYITCTRIESSAPFWDDSKKMGETFSHVLINTSRAYYPSGGKWTL